jgi:hypothetical protein
MSDFRFGAGEGFFDLSILTNAWRISDQFNNPVPWGSHGQFVTGDIPTVYLHGDSTNYANNLGSGGSFTVHGSLSALRRLCNGASPSPQTPIVWVDEEGIVIADDPVVYVVPFT